jgi:hypothetical protein
MELSIMRVSKKKLRGAKEMEDTGRRDQVGERGGVRKETVHEDSLSIVKKSSTRLGISNSLGKRPSDVDNLGWISAFLMFGVTWPLAIWTTALILYQAKPSAFSLTYFRRSCKKEEYK